MYEALAASETLPGPWTAFASSRASEYRGRARPSARERPPELEPGATQLVCMEPEFEGILVQDETSLRRVLSMTANHDWPRRWDPAQRKLDRVLGPIVESLPRTHPAKRAIRGGWRERKAEWGEYFLRALLQDQRGATAVAGHPTAQRLAEILD